MDSVLLLGASGLLGSNLISQICSDFRVFAIEHRNPVHLPESRKLKISEPQTNKVVDFINANQISIIINLAALTSVDECEKNLDQAFELNVNLAAKFAYLAKLTGAYYVLISTDHLYSDVLGKKSEADPVDLVNIYAKTKHQGEKLTIETNPNTLIIRTNFYGRSSIKKVSFSDWLYSSLQSNLVVTALTDVYFTPISMQKFAQLLNATLALKPIGVFNFSIDQIVTKYEFALRFAKLLDFSENLVQPITLSDLNLVAKRPRCMELDNSKLKALLRLETIDFEKDLQSVCYEYRKETS